MSDFYDDFSKVDSLDWISKVKKDLKGKDLEETLHYHHPIEGIDYKAYAFSQGSKDNYGVPGRPSFLRGNDTADNDWVINVNLPELAPKELNKLALSHLMKGATGLKINLFNYSVEDCDIAVQDIEFEYITVSFKYNTEDQKLWLQNKFGGRNDLKISLSSDLEQSELILNNGRSITIKADEVQSAGGNVVQEIAWALHRGHEKLHKLLNAGKSLEEACQQLKFRFGIGGTYFFEIAKFRSFRTLWYEIVQAYSNEDQNLGKAYIEAQTGFVNKSLNDPHTNLLRQTTEALSAVVGGIDELTVLPYNWYAKSPDLIKTQRLATNIGLLLKEESYLDKVIDPSGGSYNVEALCSSISDKAWKIFQGLERGDRTSFEKSIKSTAKTRVEVVENKEFTHIGVNKYFNDSDSQDEWGELPTTTFGDMLILEQAIKIEA